MKTKIIATLVCIFLYTTLACAQGYKRPESYNYQRGVEAIQNENPQEALEYLNKDIAENPKNGYSFSWIAMLRLQNEEFGKALTAADLALKYLPKKDAEYVPVMPTRHSVRMVNGIQCVTARAGDTWDALAKELKVSKKKLLKFNEVDEDFAPQPEMNIFLDKKAKKADAQYKDYWHKVKAGESMYTICQFYGIRLDALYKMNFKDDTYIPVTGDLLKVR